jgi:hypothetical protein
MFFERSNEMRISKLEREVKKLKNTVNTLKKLEEESSILTDPIKYTDVSGNEGSYKRVGEYIEFTGQYPPNGINIITESLIFTYDGGKRARVIGWTRGQQVAL